MIALGISPLCIIGLCFPQCSLHILFQVSLLSQQFLPTGIYFHVPSSEGVCEARIPFSDERHTLVTHMPRRQR